MKKWFSALLAVMVCVAQFAFPTVAGAAEVTDLAKVTAIYFADPGTYGTAQGQIDVSTNKDEAVGGKVRWDYGIIAVEPKTGYTVDRICFGSDGTGETITLTTYEQAVKNFNGVDFPKNLKNIVSPTDWSAAQIGKETVAVFVPRETYTRTGGGLTLVCKDASGNESTECIRLERDELNTEFKIVQIGDSLNVNDFILEGKSQTLGDYFEQTGLSIADYAVNVSAGDGYEIDYMMRSADEMTLCPTLNGRYEITYTNKTDGREIVVRLIAKAPAVDKDVTVKLNGEALSLDGNEVYMYATINMTETQTGSDFTIAVNVPSGVTIDWDNCCYSYVKGIKFKENDTTHITYNYMDVTPRTVDVTHSVDAATGENLFHVVSDYPFMETIYLSFKSGSTSFMKYLSLHSELVETTTLNINCAIGAQAIYVSPYSTHSIFEFIDVSSEGKTKEEAQKVFLERMDSGRYNVTICGGTLLQDVDGKYTGEITFYHTGFRMDVEDSIKLTSICGADTLVVCNSRYAVTAGETVNLKDIFGTYWGNVTSASVSGEGFSYDQTTGTITTPATVTEEYVTGKAIVKGYVNGETKVIGTILVDACKAKSYDDAITDILEKEIAEGETLVIDSEDSPNQDTTNGALISEEILDAIADGTDISLEIKTEDDGRDITWVLDSDKLETTDKDLMVDVDVKDVDDAIQVEFKDNGVLPGEVTVRIDLTEEEAKMLGIDQPGVGVDLEYIPDDGKAVIEQENLVVHEDPLVEGQYYIEIPVTHNSTFRMVAAEHVAKPSSVAATNQKSSIKVSWKKVTGATGYYIYRAENKGSYAKLATVTRGTSYTDSKSLKNGATYSYKIIAYKKYGKKNIKSASAIAKTVFLKASDMSAAKAASNGMTITWKANTKAGGYYIYRSTDGKKYTKLATITKYKTVSYTDKSAKSGKKYYYKVVAYKKVGSVTYKSVAGTVKSNYFVKTPALTVAKTSKGASLTWKKDSGATGYILYRSTDGKKYTQIKKITKNSTVKYTDTKAKAGTKYYYKIVAYKTVSKNVYTGAEVKKAIKL